MKYFTIALFLGAAQAAEPVWSLQTLKDHRFDKEVQQAYGDYSIAKAEKRPPYQSAVQVRADSDSDSEESEDENLQLAGPYFVNGENGYSR